ncbi:hypothetical protein [Staphylococcus gallinarum]|uniref:hypothetical protein n=1 Tax=Staphylococcus gallinarum TaxID=1293 RepID=UPI001E623E9B|nr:hypothetical protein [Staphylococcus gallinarum]MCD8844316.1 hypothetical protein [Staphylococcus gallinarum]MDW4261152.1 hypothetical protein [Staphylococcus saprophyticus]
MESIYQSLLGLNFIGFLIGFILLALEYYNLISYKGWGFVGFYIKIMPVIFILFVISALLYVFV